MVSDRASLHSIFEEAIKIYRQDKATSEQADNRKEEREERTSKAQTEATDWARRAFFVSLAQLPVGIVTLWFLIKTFQETRRTADAADKTANAAIGAERAWLLLSIVNENFESCIKSFTEDGMAKAIRTSNEINASWYHPQIEFFFENFGKTPAFIKGMYARLELHSDIPDQSFHVEGPLPRDSIVAGGGQWPPKDFERSPIDGEQVAKQRLIRKLTIRLSDSSAAAIKNGHARIWFYGQLRYDDVWGEEHRSQFCWSYNGITGWFTQHGGKPYNENT
ncbi:hypothetical protein KQX62_00635 [Rhodopseudomonas palustris]|uniref:Uncharacterized protein n=1 Tax=Rhodopseudomonas palustris TaxID=1076 RepID=A0AAX3DYH0_RHOPL|nr:hypothetical protein [Rhodopseudomonas palustris]UYO39849.1 hypothetical protein KQX62_00635 [Rhodopseudomonas palustris]